MPPPPAEQLASRLFLGPALRTQPDRRLVRLVRDGYEAAFEEIVRRYRRPLDRFAASLVGSHSEDVTQDAFSKALLALRGSENEIELRPWLYRIVRNTALNDIRDRPPAAEQLAETIAGGASAAAEVERREEMAELIGRLRALPEPQRAAIVMRELEGLSHEEIAAALGVSGGAARQAIYRARAALRNGLGMLVPLPLLRALFDHGADAAGAGGAAVAAGAASAGAGTGGMLGGIGAGGALKVGVATALLAGSVGAGVAIQHGGGGRPAGAAQASAAEPQATHGPLTRPVGTGAGSGSEAHPTGSAGPRPSGSHSGNGGPGSGGPSHVVVTSPESGGGEPGGRGDSGPGSGDHPGHAGPSPPRHDGSGSDSGATGHHSSDHEGEEGGGGSGEHHSGEGSHDGGGSQAGGGSDGSGEGDKESPVASEPSGGDAEPPEGEEEDSGGGSSGSSVQSGEAES